MDFSQRMAAFKFVAAIFSASWIVAAASGQTLAVQPVNVFLAPGQTTATLTVVDQGTESTSIQIRVFAWNQSGGKDSLVPSSAVVVSPPIATIAPGSKQIVRLVLRKPPQGREDTYRVLLDQIPPPAQPGIVHIVLRLSIPVFAEPETRALPHDEFRIERRGDQLLLVGVNGGLRHDVIRSIVLSTHDGHELKVDPNELPYILAGATRQWPITVQGPLPLPGTSLQLTAHADSGVIDEQVQVVSAP